MLCFWLQRASCGGAQLAPSRMPSQAPVRATLWGWPRALEGFQVGGRQPTLLRAGASAWCSRRLRMLRKAAPLDSQVEGCPAPAWPHWGQRHQRHQLLPVAGS